MTSVPPAIGLVAGTGLFRIKIPSQSESEIPALSWFQGRMEFGPRALGARSILGGPRPPTMKTLNLKVKYRESFRLAAPLVLREDPVLRHDYQGALAPD